MHKTKKIPIQEKNNKTQQKLKKKSRWIILISWLSSWTHHRTGYKNVTYLLNYPTAGQFTNSHSALFGEAWKQHSTRLQGRGGREEARRGNRRGGADWSFRAITPRCVPDPYCVITRTVLPISRDSSCFLSAIPRAIPHALPHSSVITRFPALYKCDNSCFLGCGWGRRFFPPVRETLAPFMWAGPCFPWSLCICLKREGMWSSATDWVTSSSETLSH